MGEELPTDDSLAGVRDFVDPHANLMVGPGDANDVAAQVGESLDRCAHVEGLAVPRQESVDDDHGEPDVDGLDTVVVALLHLYPDLIAGAGDADRLIPGVDGQELRVADGCDGAPEIAYGADVDRHIVPRQGELPVGQDAVWDQVDQRLDCRQREVDVEVEARFLAAVVVTVVLAFVMPAVAVTVAVVVAVLTMAVAVAMVAVAMSVVIAVVVVVTASSPPCP